MPEQTLPLSLVEAGFVVAMPQHRGDNHLDKRHPGPQSWLQRPAEVSRAIDAMGRDGRFLPLLNLEKVGMYGMSAGGHTALSLAGGQWSPMSFSRHCETHLAEDFQTCVGLITRLTGGMFDGLKKWGPWPCTASNLTTPRRKFTPTHALPPSSQPCPWPPTSTWPA